MISAPPRSLESRCGGCRQINYRKGDANVVLVEAVGGPRAAGRVRERSGNIVGLDVHGRGGSAGDFGVFLMLSRQLPLPTQNYVET